MPSLKHKRLIEQFESDDLNSVVVPTVYGICKRIDNEVVVIRCWKGTIGNMQPTDDHPTILCPEKLEPLILKHKRTKVLYGGRGGAKSVFALSAMLGEVNATGCGVFCFREHQKSVDQSIIRTMSEKVDELNFGGFTVTESTGIIRHANKGVVFSGGLMFIRDIKSAYKFRFFLLEESAKVTAHSINTLAPSLRGVDNGEMWLLFNPEASNDPVCEKYVLPYQKEIEENGFYEDEHRLIINIGFRDNPFFPDDSGLVAQLGSDIDEMKRGIMSKSMFNHIWEGKFLDSITNGIIKTEWIEAAFDAHLKLDFKPVGQLIAASDLSDSGHDKSTIGARRGSVVTELKIIPGSDMHAKFVDTCGMVYAMGASKFVWDAQGMGVGLKPTAAQHLPQGCSLIEYKGGRDAIYFPNKIFNHESMSYVGMPQVHAGSSPLRNEDIFLNRRVQDYFHLAERFRRTYDSVENGTYYDPATLISIPSDIADKQTLISELGRLPLKEGMDRMQMYSKEQARKGILQPDGERVRIPSPNLADTLAMLFSEGYLQPALTAETYHYRPPIKPMGSAVDYHRNRGSR